ncbi:hypothetical protein [Dyadobacter crusticola]|uniref:hypothetical protein n=1 Tax=Dyadobacter crusticola TaxID=292407 RepID=UPI0004E1F11E|nr:hypothetical protein [Dyadobacter crusticola]
MQQVLIILLLLSFECSSQPYYTKIRANVGAEIAGLAPQLAITAEAITAYKPRSFAGIQAGLGWLERRGFKSPSLSAAATYNYLLNPYRRKSCIPNPGSNLIEAYLESGFGAFFVDPYDNNPYRAVTVKHRFVTPSALGGVRLHFVSPKWIYILKLRCTPTLVKSKFDSVAGVSVGLGWR